MSETAEDPRLLALASAISDGTPIDWDNLPFDTSCAHGEIVAALRLLEQIAGLSNGVRTSWHHLRIVDEIGRGAFGVVFRAVDPTLEREVALKVIRPAGREGAIDPERALWEARSLAKIDHPNIVRVFAAEQVDGEVGISMELIRGETLAAIVERNTCGPDEAMIIGRDVCRALAAVHSIDKLHGDIKAHNVMREEGGRIVLMDFGTGRDLRTSSPIAMNGTHGADMAGTPAYLAPEVFSGAPRSKASDIYSVGVLLYYLVSGRYPVVGDTRSEVIRHHQQKGRPVPLRDIRADLPDAFIQVVERALSDNPADRFPSAGAFEAALTSGLAVSRSHGSRRRSTVLMITAIIGAIGAPAVFGAWVWLPRPAPAAAAASPVAVSTPTGEYSIGAALYLEEGGSEVRLPAGATIRPGQKLSLRLQSSIPVHVYVINEDEHGESYLLFPLPGQTLRNPLPAGESNRLPGASGDEVLSWQVSSAGRREHFFIVASPDASPVMERLAATIPPSVHGRPVQHHHLSAGDVEVLRGVGGLAASDSPADRQLRNDRNFATPLSSSDETARGLWIRRLTLENPTS